MKPKPLSKVMGEPGNLVWLTVKLDDSSLSVGGLDILKRYKDQWVLARGKWIDQLGRFHIDPTSFVFVYDPKDNVYRRVHLPLN